MEQAGHAEEGPGCVAVVLLEGDEGSGTFSISFCAPEMWESGPRDGPPPPAADNTPCPKPRSREPGWPLGVFTKGRAPEAAVDIPPDHVSPWKYHLSSCHLKS